MSLHDGQDTGATEPDSVWSAALAIAALDSDDSEDTKDTDAPRDLEPDELENAVEDSDDEQLSDDSDEPADDDEEQEDKPSEPRKFKVKANGEDLEVTEEELTKGYSRTADYTRKTQELSEKAKAFEAEQTEARAERQRTAALLSQLETAVKSMAQEPDWDKLREEDPALFPQVFANWQLHQKRISAIEAEHQKAVEAVQADNFKAHQAFLAEQKAKLVEAVPEWKDPEVSKKELTALREYGGSIGFSPEELNSVLDHRALVMLRKAMLYDQSQTEKVKVTAKAQDKIERVKAVKPGSANNTPAKVTEAQRRQKRLRQTGSVQDAARLLELSSD